jgi:ACS family sodium-dependent inorganic phosphate cotransporter
MMSVCRETFLFAAVAVILLLCCWSQQVEGFSSNVAFFPRLSQDLSLRSTHSVALPSLQSIRGDLEVATANDTTGSSASFQNKGEGRQQEVTTPPSTTFYPDYVYDALSSPTLEQQEPELVVGDEASTQASSTQDDAKTLQRETWLMMGLLWIVALLSALDRVAMSVALVPMSDEFGFSDTVKGSISSLFSVGYGLMILPAGLLVANLSPRAVMGVGMAVWSLATLLTPPSAELLLRGAEFMAPLLLVRAYVGAGESLVIPTIQRLLAVWTTADRKSLALAFIYSGFHTGTIAAYLLSPVVMESMGGWRGLFDVYGAVGLLLLVPWLLLAKDAPSVALPGTGCNNAVVVESEPKLEPKSSWEESLQMLKEAPWMDFARSKGAWAMLLAHSAKNWGLYVSLAWTPTFYAEQYGIGVRESALLSVTPSIAGAVGGFLAGTAADSILRNWVNDVDDEARTLVRKAFQVVGLLGPALIMGLLGWNIPEEASVAQTFLMAAVFLQAFNAAGFEAGNQDKAGERWAGLLYSVTSLPAVMGKFASILQCFTGGRVMLLTICSSV